MFILDYPYISGLLEATVLKRQIPVLKNKATQNLGLNGEINFKNDEEFISLARKHELPMIYANSENPIDWISNNLSFTHLPEYLHMFKDKVRFREIISELYPDFFFRRIMLQDLDTIDINSLPLPFVIKPAVGFFSLGVHIVNNAGEWEKIKTTIRREIDQVGRNYPPEVVNVSSFIIEELVEGDEFAVDVYYDEKGNAVILNILKHLFASGEDVSDRVYITSRQIMETYLDDFEDFLTELGKMTNLSAFPMHIEFRMNQKGGIVPIEVNPMRFAGWCVTDIAYYAYGINVYEYFYDQRKPAWDEILSSMGDEIYSVVVADLPRDIPVEKIRSINYKLFVSRFEHPLELREVDFRKHGVFAFMFARTNPEKMYMLENILKSDLREFLVQE